MKKIIGFIICMLLITTTSISVLGINDKEDRLFEENTLSFFINPKSNNQIDEWSLFRHDLNNTGYSTSPAPDDDNVLWSKDIAYDLKSNPTVKDERLYIVDNTFSTLGRGGEVYCFNAFTGKEIWKTYQVSDEVWGSPTVANDRVYVLGMYLNLYCYDANNGEELWRFEALGHCSPMVIEDKLYFGCQYGGKKGFYCLNATTGDIIWDFDTSTYSSACTPAIVDGKVYVGNDAGNFYCLEAYTGDVVWVSPHGGGWSSPSFYDDKIYVATDHLYCLNAINGDEVWADPRITTSSSPAVAYGNVYIGNGASDGKVYCFDAENGDLIWDSQSLGNSIFNGAAVADGKIFTCSNGNPAKFNCLDAFTGEIIWQFDFNSNFAYTSPAVANGNVYVGSTDGYFYAFGTPNEAPEPPLKPDGPYEGRVYVEYTFNSSATDPEGDEIYYLFDWGDGSNSGWIGPYTSGEEVSASHIWTEIGDYEIRVKAHDGKRKSNWSEPLTFYVTSPPPDAPSIDGPTSGKPGESYNFTFNSVDPDGYDLYYYINWGDGAEEEWNGPHPSGEDFVIDHSFPSKKTFTIEAKAKDISNAESNWSYFDIKIPRTRANFNPLFHWFLDQFPLLEKLLNLIRICLR